MIVANHQTRGVRKSGFTLIEIIGVLSILAVLAAVITPPVIKMIDRAVKEKEVSGLDALATALVAAVLENRIIPLDNNGPGRESLTAFGDRTREDWAELIAARLDEPFGAIVIEVERGCPRRYWFDPGSSLFDRAAGGDPNAYEQDRDTLPSAPVTRARAMLITDLTIDCVNGVFQQDMTSAGDFEKTWEQASGGLKENPSLLIQRINFTRLFKRVTLLSVASSLSGREGFSNIGKDSGPRNVVALPPASRLTRVFLNGSFGAANASGVGGPTRLIVRRDKETLWGPHDVDGGAHLPARWSSDPGADPVTAAINVALDVAEGGRVNGYVEVTAEFHGDPGFAVFPRSTVIIDTSCASGFCDDVSNPQTIYLLDGSELRLLDQNGAWLMTKIVKETEGLTYSPGPPAAWSD